MIKFEKKSSKLLPDISSDRKYLIMNMEHRSWPLGAALFWGRITCDDAPERSFSGYTTRVDQCERYTREELESYRFGLKEYYPFFDELKEQTLRELRKHEDVLITLEELESMGFRNWAVMVIP